MHGGAAKKMEPAQIAVVLASPFVAALVGVLLWWRMGQVEKEVARLRDTKQEMQVEIARMQGAVASMREMLTEVLHVALGRRGRPQPSDPL